MSRRIEAEAIKLKSKREAVIAQAICGLDSAGEPSRGDLDVGQVLVHGVTVQLAATKK